LRRNNNNNYKQFKPRDKNAVGGLTVEVRNNDINYALRKFKKKIQEDGILQELRERQHYVKPSEKRKKAKAAGRARWLKKQAKQKADLGY
jgi:small subunit ribosomal protein S21